jgi:hypothetical protein
MELLLLLRGADNDRYRSSFPDDDVSAATGSIPEAADGLQHLIHVKTDGSIRQQPAGHHSTGVVPSAATYKECDYHSVLLLPALRECAAAMIIM